MKKVILMERLMWLLICKYIKIGFVIEDFVVFYIML